MDKMKKKQQFIKPEILREVALLGDGPILAGSVVNNATVVSAGQTVHEMNYDNTQEWNQEWTWE